MARIETSHQDETLDAMVWRVTGRGAVAVEEVLAANPGLAAGARVMPAGVEVLIPDAALKPAQTPMIQLWD